MPTLWPFEVANSLLVLLRRKRRLVTARDRAIAAMARFPMVVDEDSPRLAFGRI